MASAVPDVFPTSLSRGAVGTAVDAEISPGRLPDDSSDHRVPYQSLASHDCRGLCRDLDHAHDQLDGTLHHDHGVALFLGLQ